MAAEQNGVASGSANASERTPLLGDSAKRDDVPQAEADENARPSETEDGTPLAEEVSTKKLMVIMGATFTGLFFAALDGTIVATLAGPISSSFDSFSLFGWIASSYILATATIQPLSGKLTDIFGRRTGMLVCYAFFAAGCLICGLAQSPYVLIAGRVISGVGGGGILSISVFILTDLVSLRSRGLWQGYGNLVYSAAVCLGAPFGGLMNDRLNWRWAFFIQIPFVAASAVAVAFLVKIPVKDTGKNRLLRIDFPGALLLVTALILLLLGIDLGGNHLGWKHPAVLVCLPLSAVVLVIFVWVEANIAKEPIIPVRLITRQTVWAACLCTLLYNTVTLSIVYYVPLFFQARGLSATQAGLGLIPMTIGASSGSVGAGWLTRKLGSYYWLMWACMAIGLAGVGLCQTISFGQSDQIIWASVAILGFGFGAVSTINMTALVASVDQKDQATVTSACYAFRQVGASTGITISSALFHNVLKSELWKRLGERPGGPEAISHLRKSLRAIDRIPKSWRPDVLTAYENGFSAVFWLVFAFAAGGVLFNAFIREHKLYSNLARNK